MVVSLTRNTRPINFLGLPALSVTCGFTPDGMPASFQIMDAACRALLLRIGRRFHMAPVLQTPTNLGPPTVKQPLADGLLGDRQSRHFTHSWRQVVADGRDLRTAHAGRRALLSTPPTRPADGAR